MSWWVLTPSQCRRGNDPDQPLRRVWGQDQSTGSGPVRAIVRRLRRNLGEDASERLLERDDVSKETKRMLRKSRLELDPVSLLHSIRESQSALAAVGSSKPESKPDAESLESFLNRLPDLWRQGEVRPTHTRMARRLRTWRTRADPFEGAWCEILSWLQEQPDATAAELMDRLIRRNPERYSRRQLRTLQRRVR